MSHFLLSRISTLYTDPSVLQLIAMTRSIYLSNEEETPPNIYRAFMQGTYHNVPDFWDFCEKLRNSLWRVALDSERKAISLVHGSSDVLDAVPSELYDQRDLTVMMDCELPGNPLPEEFTRIGPLQKVGC
jgi:N-acetyltransferase B complex (NatB) non catalytic subunit